MTKTKIILITVALFLLIMAVVGFSFVQYVNTQSQNTTFNQTHKVTLETVDSCHLTVAMAALRFYSKALTPTELAWKWE